MKRTFIKMLPLVAAVLLATSCSKDGNDDNDVVIDPVETQNVASPDNDGVTIVPLTITVNKDGSSLSKASVDVKTGTDGKYTYTQKFIAGDVLVISNSDDFDVLKEDATFTLKSEDVGQSTATFEGELSVKPGEALTIGTTKLNAVLKNTGSADNKKNSGQPVVGVQEVSSLEEGFEKYGYLTANNFTYKGDKTSIQLVQNTVFLHITLSSGKSNAIVNNEQYTVDDNGEIFLAVASGTEIESNLFSGKKIVTSDGGKVVKNIKRTSKQKDAFTINESGTQVYFSQGNLQYNKTDNKWRFAEHQYDYVGGTVEGNHVGNVKEGGDNCTNDNLTGPWIDLFGWVGASSEWKEAPQMYGVSVSEIYNDYGTGATESLQSDWGNVPDIGKGWYTLSKDEWEYLLGKPESNVLRKGKNGLGTITIGSNTYFGLIIVPDDYDDPADVTQKFVSGTTNTTYFERDWTAMETAGAVFLPAAGSREGSSVSVAGFYGLYWSSSADVNGSVFFVNFRSDYFGPVDSDLYRHYGFSVRLVRSL